VNKIFSSARAALEDVMKDNMTIGLGVSASVAYPRHCFLLYVSSALKTLPLLATMLESMGRVLVGCYRLGR